MSKLRVYELAKQYDKKGHEMAEILRGLGFPVKGHMSVLDEADQMIAIARLEAQGLRATGSSDDDAEPDQPQLRKLPRRKDLPDADAKKPLPPRRLPSAHSGPGGTVYEATQPELEVEPEQTPPPRTEAAAAASTPPVRTEPRSVEAPPEPPGHIEAAATPAAAEPAREAPATPRSEPEPTPAVEAPAVAPRPETPATESTRSTPEPVPAASLPAATPPVAATPPTTATPPAAASPAAAASTPDAPAETKPEAPAAPRDDVKRLLTPQPRATVLGKIQLPESTIRDANRRSAPRDPGSVSQELRRKALTHTQSRSATRTGPGQRRGPGQRSGPGVRGRGRDQGGRRGGRGRAGSGISTPIDPDKVIEIEPPITVKGLSEALGVKVGELIAALTFKLGVAGKTINSFLNNDEVELVADEVQRKIVIVEHKEAEEQLLEDFVSAAEDHSAHQRAPVLTFMGHVDHGKTTLLDALRDSDVVKGEAGGITQHIGAYKITTRGGEQFVVLDTPGHAAFTSMRARGASLTDIVILVVAADDGVMPQTEEAIAHALEAKVPIVVAINKCDAPGANSMQVRQQLAVKGLQPEEWGGNTQVVDVSALTGQGLDDLVEKIMLEAELLELTAKPEADGSGIVVESRQSAEQGIVVNVLVTDGTLRLRDMVICGESYSRVRGMVDDHGNSISEAGPSTPVSIIGLAKLPNPGDRFLAVKDAKRAKAVVEDRQRRARANDLADRSRVTAENLAAKLRDQEIEELKVVLKADVMGSLEPIRNGLADIGTDEVRVNIIHKGLGAVTESDVVLAEASNAIIIAFNTVPEASARLAAERSGIEIRQYNIIYRLLDDMKLALEGMLKPEEIEEVDGHAEIRAVFKSSKFGNIAGCYVTDGTVNRNHEVRVARDGKVVYRGKIGSLRRVDDDVREVRENFECGLTITNFNDIKVGDVLEFFRVKLVARTLD
ncbi:MAG: translation initiation factor IF-2 [Planctomycetes bacterium]|nr:translation initiation factor IF-2 [Planctomycetota bacterium]